MGTLRRLSRETVVYGKALDFCRDTVELPDGKIEEWDFVHHKRGGGACVVPVLPDGRILMVRQMRPAIDRECLELPAGAVDPEDNDRSVTAGRELLEETGYSCETLRFLCNIRTAVAYCDEMTGIYLAEGLSKASDQHLDEAEEITPEAYTLAELLSQISSGEIDDAKTVAGLLAYAAFIG